MDGPNLILLAGPNGAGKPTASLDLLAGALNVHHFVNADEIALQLSGEHAAIAAGRIMLERLSLLTGQRANVAFESTLATRSFCPLDSEVEGFRLYVYAVLLLDTQS